MQNTFDVAGRRRSPATFPEYLAGGAPKNKGRRYPADPPGVEEIMAVMREAGQGPPGIRIGVGGAELLRGEASPHPRPRRQTSELRADRGRRPRLPRGRSPKDAEERPDR